MLTQWECSSLAENTVRERPSIAKGPVVVDDEEEYLLGP